MRSKTRPYTVLLALCTFVGALAAAGAGPVPVAADLIAPLALTTEDYVNMRSGPDTGYRILAQLPTNTRAEVIDEQGGWYRIRTPWGAQGWLAGAYLTVLPAARAAVARPHPERMGTGNVAEGPLFLRSGPGPSASLVARLPVETQLDVLARQGAWYQVHTAGGATGWVAAEFVALDQPLASYGGSPHPPASTASSDVVRVAYRYLGARYVWGGWQPGGFDCSGLTKYVYSRLGVWLPGTADDQLDSAYGRIIRTIGALQPGDLVYFERTSGDPDITHAGIYVGGGLMIAARSERLGVGYASLYEPFWNTCFVAGLRPYR